MKILIINTVGFRLNGITAVIMNYYRAINKSDISFDFITINEVSKEYREELENNNSNIYCCERRKNPLKYMIDIYNVMKKNKYDIVHVHGNSSIMGIETLLAKLAGVPIRIAHSHNTTCKHMTLHKILYPVLKYSYTNGFACGEEAGKWIFRENNFDIIRNGIDMNKFKYDDDLRTEYRSKINASNKKVIGHIGNFVYQKNHEFLIDVFYEIIKEDKNYLLVLISEGPLKESIEEKVKELGIEENVVFVGKTNEIIGYLHAMDIFVLPSHYEGLPVVLIEAQALGLECIVSHKVSSEAAITDLIKFLPIDNIEVWKNNIMELDIKSKSENIARTNKQFEKSGYNIEIGAENLRWLYKSYLDNLKR